MMGVAGLQYRNSALVPIRSISREVNFSNFGRRTASAIPFGEAIMVPRHVATRDVTTLMVLPVPGAVLAAVDVRRNHERTE